MIEREAATRVLSSPTLQPCNLRSKFVHQSSKDEKEPRKERFGDDPAAYWNVQVGTRQPETSLYFVNVEKPRGDLDSGSNEP